MVIRSGYITAERDGYFRGAKQHFEKMALTKHNIGLRTGE
jgi:hypothetical protein